MRTLMITLCFIRIHCFIVIMKNQFTYDDGGVFGTFTGGLRFGDLEGVERFEFFSTSSKNDQSALRSESVGKK